MVRNGGEYDGKERGTETEGGPLTTAWRRKGRAGAGAGRASNSADGGNLPLVRTWLSALLPDEWMHEQGGRG